MLGAIPSGSSTAWKVAGKGSSSLVSGQGSSKQVLEILLSGYLRTDDDDVEEGAQFST